MSFSDSRWRFLKPDVAEVAREAPDDLLDLEDFCDREDLREDLPDLPDLPEALRDALRPRGLSDTAGAAGSRPRDELRWERLPLRLLVLRVLPDLRSLD